MLARTFVPSRIKGLLNIRGYSKRPRMGINYNSALDLSPPVNREMKTLDKEFFTKEFNLVRAHFEDPRIIAQFVRKYPQDVIALRSVRTVYPIGEYTAKAVLLTDKLRRAKDADKVLSEGTLQYFATNKIKLHDFKLKVDYDFWKAEEILAAILPEDLLDDIPSGFTQTGHIAHLNLKSEFKPYKHLIGEVVLSKNASIKTVVDKVDSIDTQFRTFKMEVLAGEPDLIVTHKEQNCLFKFDFEKVYWNSRLHTEHERLVNLVNEGELLMDVMAGVGPFSVPAGKKRVIVLANDLNPESYKYLDENSRANKTQDFVKCSNDDGHDFIKNCMDYVNKFREEKSGVILSEIVKRNKSKTSTSPKVQKVEIPIPKFPKHFVMNLPDSALEFLTDYNGIYHKHQDIKEAEGFELPYIHVYCFEKFSPDEPEPTEDEIRRRVYKRITGYLQYEDLKYEDVVFQLVRKVSPTKPMYRATFKLPEEVAFRAPVN